MNLDFSPQDVAFRQEVRDFIAAEYPAALREKQESGAELGKEDFLVLAPHRWPDKGWVAPAWPKEYGGPGWSPIQRFIFSEELAAAGTIPILPFGIAMVAPVIQAFGTPEQKARFLPAILSGDAWWCQGYSEPGSGSDLASLSTRCGKLERRPLRRQRAEDLDHAGPARRLGLLPGAHQPYGEEAGRHQLPAHRHDQSGRDGAPDHHPGRRPRGQRGVARKRPGAGGEPHPRGERGLDLRQVPARPRAHRHRRRGPIQARAGASCGRSPPRRRTRTCTMPRPTTRSSGRKMAEVEIDLLALEYTELRAMARQGAGKGPGPESSLLKIKGTEMPAARQRAGAGSRRPVRLPALRCRHPAAATTAMPVGPQQRDGAPPTPTSTCARPRSTAAPTRSSATSSPRSMLGL